MSIKPGDTAVLWGVGKQDQALSCSPGLRGKGTGDQTGRYRATGLGTGKVGAALGGGRTG